METSLQQIIECLLDQNAELRYELAILRATQKNLARESGEQIPMMGNIPPEAAEMLSKLDIR